MKKSLVFLAVAGSLAVGMAAVAPVAQAAPGGCLKYGVAGAAAGHMVHHGVRGFMAGCAAGMYRRHLYNKQMRNGAATPTSTPAPTNSSGAVPAGKQM